MTRAEMGVTNNNTGARIEGVSLLDDIEAVDLFGFFTSQHNDMTLVLATVTGGGRVTSSRVFACYDDDAVEALRALLSATIKYPVVLHVFKPVVRTAEQQEQVTTL